MSEVAGEFNAVLRLPLNTKGRDFVVGDIHGAYDLVIAAMRAVKFDGSRDRLISVGDLVDRGSGSHRCLGFLRQPYVSAARGNHEAGLLQLDYEQALVLARMNFNGMAWIENITEEQYGEMMREFSRLPLAIEVETDRGLVGIVHGDVPRGMSWPAFIAALERGDENAIQTALEGRERLQQRFEEGVAGVGRVYVGHTVQWAGPSILGNVFGVDTGACVREIHDRGSLTFSALTAVTASLHAPSKAQTRAGVAVFDEVSDRPFGHGLPRIERE